MNKNYYNLRSNIDVLNDLSQGNFPFIDDMIIAKNKGSTINKHDEFFYVSKNTVDLSDDIIDSTIDYLRSYVLDLYMKQMYTFDVPSYFFDPMFSYPQRSIKLDASHDLKVMSNVLRRLLNKFPEDETLTWKVRSDRCIMYFELFRKQALNDTEVRNALNITMFDPHDNIMTMFNITADKDFNWHYDNDVGPFYVMGDNRDLRKMINPEGAYFNQYIINVVKESMRMIKNRIDDYDTDGIDIISRMYSNFEMRIFRKLVLQINSNIRPIVILFTWKSSEWEEFYAEKDRFSEMDKKKSAILELVDNSDPLVDLTDKEWSYIDKFVNKRHFFEEEAEEYDISTCFLKSRYGIDLNIKINDEVITTRCEYEPELDILRVHIMKVLTDDIVIFSLVDFVDIRKFNGHKFLAMSTNVAFKDADKMTKSIVDFNSLINNYFIDDSDLLKLAMRIIGLHMVIYERPHRTKMIRCTRIEDYEPKNDEPKKRNYKRNSEKEYVVSRILRPAKEATAYVKKMSSSSEGTLEREFEYVLESWPRMAHTRRLRNGKLIDVSETICYRHLPLTDKEVHIKM